MEVGYLQEVKAIIKSLVLSCPNAITVEKLNRDFRDVEGSYIPFRKLGYQSLESFLRCISDTVQVSGNGPTATVRIVLNQKSDHIHQMVRQQKRTKRPKGKGSVYRLATYDQEYNARAASTWSRSISLSKRTTNNEPISSIQFSHAVVRNTQHATVTKCRAQMTPTMICPSNQRNISESRSGQQCGGQQEQDIPALVCAIKSTIASTMSTPIQMQSSIPISVSEEQINDCKVLLEKCKIKEELSQSVEKNESLKCKLPKPVRLTSVSKKDALKNESKLHEIFQTTASSEELKILDDMDEAVPAFAANNLVFRIDFPDNTMVFGKKILPYKLPENLKCGSIIGIFISEIHTPFKFWFHIHKENHELDSLMLHIERFYRSVEPEEFRIPKICICPGQVCAALYNGMWHRAEILSPVIKNKAKVLFVDYGTVSEIHVNGIKFLPMIFGHLPTQAIRGSLSHIQPRGLHWSQEATHNFLSMACELMLYGQVSEIDEQDRVVYMVLCDTNGSEVVQINKTLVEKGFAIYDEEWQKLKFEKGEHRLRHLREDFPTFPMLEMGEYPSYFELVDLLKRGIDYERIIDYNVYHPGKLNHYDNVPEAIRNLPFQLLTTNPFRYEILLELRNLVSS